ncbi:MAG: histidine kinase, partial [Bacteroidota bacterium]
RLEDFGVVVSFYLLSKQFNLGSEIYEIKKIYTYTKLKEGEPIYVILGKHKRGHKTLAISLIRDTLTENYWFEYFSFDPEFKFGGKARSLRMEKINGDLELSDIETDIFGSYYKADAQNYTLADISSSASINREGEVRLFDKAWKVVRLYSADYKATGNFAQTQEDYEIQMELLDQEEIESRILRLKKREGQFKLISHRGSGTTEYMDSSEIFRFISLYVSLFLLLLSLVLFISYRLFVLPRKLKQRLSQVQLAGIKSQLNPHFLFNSMASIQSLMNQGKTQAANTYLNDFSDLLRYHLDAGSEDLVLLSEELSALQHYCQLEQLRSPFKLSLELDTQLEPENIEIPNQILQIILENAIKHGVRNTEDASLEIRIQKFFQYVRISITDNGPGIRSLQELGGAVPTLRKTHKGLELIREKIKLLKKKGLNLKLNIYDRFWDLKEEENGTRVVLDIPMSY